MRSRQDWNRSAKEALNLSKSGNVDCRTRRNTMPEPAEDQIVRNLAKAIERLHEDLDRVELWTAALNCFQRPVPDYQSGERYLLPTRAQRGNAPV
jgi:hypothetical protein